MKLYSFLVAQTRLGIIFASFVLPVVSVVPICKHESDTWEKTKVIILSGFLLIFKILRFKFLVLSLIS